MKAEGGFDVPRQIEWPTFEAEMPVVAAPFRELHAIHWLVALHMRHIEHGDAAVLLAQPLPQQLLIAMRGGGAAFVARDIDLVPAMDAMAVGAHARGKGWPQSANKKAHRIAHAAARAARKQAAQVRQMTGSSKSLGEAGVAGIQADHHHRGFAPHRLFFSRTRALSVA